MINIDYVICYVTILLVNYYGMNLFTEWKTDRQTSCFFQASQMQGTAQQHQFALMSNGNYQFCV